MISVLDILSIIVALVICCYGIYCHVRLWSAGKKEDRGRSLGEGIWYAVRFGIVQKYFFREFYPGIMHLFIVVGFCIPLAVIIITQWPFALPPAFGSYFSCGLDIIGLCALIGCLLAVVRRYVLKPDRLDNKPDDAVALILVAALFFLGFVTEGFRIGITNPPNALWTPV